MRTVIAVVTTLLILGFANLAILNKESHIEQGTRVLMELAPRDPRSIMQGDYMRLRFAAGQKVQQERGDYVKSAGGYLIVNIDQRGVGNLESFQQDWPQQPLNDKQIAIRYKIRGYQFKLVTDAYFFQEGSGKKFQAARYGEFSVLANGEALLIGLWDEDLKPIHPTVYANKSMFGNHESG